MHISANTLKINFALEIFDKVFKVNKYRICMMIKSRNIH